jgi:DNA polymerase III subunit epsilon
MMRLETPLAFVDLETTGAIAMSDRITEVGIVEVSENGISEWSTLVNPEIPIPPFISHLTGISDDMVAGAPTFAELAEEIYQRLNARLFIAHNARFDHGFLKSEFRRLGMPFRPTVLCTVKLSRRLYPGFSRHNLDSLIERHRLHVTERHRALGDARLIWQFWQKIHISEPLEMIDAAIKKLTAQPSLPPHLDAALLDDLPTSHGIYRFLNAHKQVLYIGKANDLRRRVLSHFSGDHRDEREMELSQQVTHIDWIRTAGELGALLLESSLIKRDAPAYNRLLRRHDDLYAWRATKRKGVLRMSVASADDLFFDQDDDLYGLFTGTRQAHAALRQVADANSLCPALLGLDKVASGAPCFASQVKRCKGACHGAEPRDEHDARVLQALAPMRLQAWGYGGPIAIAERHSWHLIDGWAYLGSVRSRSDIPALLTQGRPGFDRDVYRLLSGRLAGLRDRIEILNAAAP